MRKILFLIVTGLLALTLFYMSRFWFLSLWPRSGLFGIETIRPQGGLLSRWLRGTEAAPFELILWAIGCFLVLSVAQKIIEMLTSPPDAGEDHD